MCWGLAFHYGLYLFLASAWTPSPVSSSPLMYRVADKIVMVNVAGSGEFMDISIYAHSDLRPLQEAVSQSDWEWQHTHALPLPEKDLLSSCGDGALIIGNYDLDPAIELTCFNWKKFWGPLSRPLQIWPDGKLQAEQGWLSTRLMRLSSKLFNLPVLLLSFLGLLSGALCLGLCLLRYLMVKAV